MLAAPATFGVETSKSIFHLSACASVSFGKVIRNGKIVWKYGPNWSFFLYNFSFENY